MEETIRLLYMTEMDKLSKETGMSIDIMDDEDGTWFFAEGEHEPVAFIEAIRDFTEYGPQLARECPWASPDRVVHRWALVEDVEDGYTYKFAYGPTAVTGDTLGAIRLTYVKDDG
jgi:hypothetical protein